MRFFKQTTTTTALLASVFCVSSIASAQGLETFASFSKRGLGPVATRTPDGSFVYTNTYDGVTPITSTLQTGSLNVSSGTFFNFLFQTENGYDNSGNNDLSTLSFSADALGAATQNTNGTFSLNLSNIVATFTAVNPPPSGNLASNSILLNLSFSSGILVFTPGSGTASFNANINDSNGIVNSPTLGYTSDYLGFNDPGITYTSEEFGITFSAVKLAQGSTTNGPTLAAGNIVNNFVADPVGTFSSNPVPPNFTPTPAPPGVVSGLVGIAMGGAQFGLVRYRRRRLAAKAAA
ncbi:MAG: hypothetical protein H7Z41_19420 [Cytophagales bacterium]|nr:hypothetical protein [Armatimonadota bacterium]